MVIFRRVIDGLAIGVVLLTLGFVLWNFAVPRSRGATRLLSKDALSLQEFISATNSGRWLGPRDASSVVLVYNDYACGFCLELHETLNQLMRRYPQHVAVVVKHFVSPSLLSHYNVPLAAECAGDQNRFTEFHHAAFANTRMLHYSSGWRALGDSARVPDFGSFVDCVLAKRHLTTVTAHYEEGKRFGVSATPTLFVDGERVVGAVPLAQLDSLVTRNFPDRAVGKLQKSRS